MKNSRSPALRVIISIVPTVGFVLGACPAAWAGVAAPWCLKSDMNYDRQRNLADVPLFVTAIITDSSNSQDRCAADCNADLLLDGRDISKFIQILLAPDTDGDGIPDMFETNDGVLASAMATGTDPNNADTDGDSLSDGDEVYATTAGLDLHALGCSPVRKNICIEFDWFDDTDTTTHSHRPTAQAITVLKNAFLNSTVPNPYGLPNGITMILDYGQGPAPFTGGNLIPGSDTVVLFDSEFNVYKAANFNPNRNGYFHYCICAHRYNSATNNSSGISELPGDDFMVTLQTFLSTNNVARTIMHELGHNLNLRHGGFENLNYKPNYNSIMNYRFQFPGIDSISSCDAVGDSITDYSRGLRIPLDENNLDEAAGTCGTVAIDWNQDSVISAGVSRNITCSAGLTFACGSWDPNNCNDTTCNGPLLDFNDWAAVSFSGIFEGDFRAREIMTCQDTPSIVYPE